MNDILVLNRLIENLLENIILIILKGDVSSTTAVGSKSLIEVESELNKTKAELDNTMSEQDKFKAEVAAKQKQLNETISKQEDELSALKLEKGRLKNQVIILKSKGLFRFVRLHLCRILESMEVKGIVAKYRF